jgi:hypothetical protein
MAERFLYRGTTRGWPGGESPRSEQKTSTRTDPLIATLFAVECRRKGEAGIYVATLPSVADLLVPPNCLAEVECEVALGILPVEFASKYSRWIPAETAKDVLGNIGFEVPETISNIGRLIEQLINSPRLTEAQIIEFNSQALR